MMSVALSDVIGQRHTVRSSVRVGTQALTALVAFA